MPSIPQPLSSKSLSSSAHSRRRKKKGRPNRLRQSSWDSADFSGTEFPSSSSVTNANVNNDHEDRRLLTGTRLLTYDFVVRSLRRRFWKALREDDVLTATRAYQATLPDFIHWLEEEQQEKKNREREDAAKKAAVAKSVSKSRSRSISPARSIVLATKQIRRTSWNQSSRDKMDEMMTPRKGRRLGREEEEQVVEEEENYEFENSDYRYELLKHQHQQRMETESMIGGPSNYILQSLMNPSDPFIADDYLSPCDESTYDHPARKTLPDPIQHAAEKKAIEDERKRRRKARGPRMAFRRMMTGKHRDRPVLGMDSPGGSHDFDLVDSMIVDANNNTYFSPGMSPSSAGNDDENPLMTTPLHEAARVGSGDFVRLLLANGGDPNVKNGSSQTTYHICAGGYNAEEKKLVEAATAAAELEESLPTGSEHSVPDKKKKKKYRRSSKNKTTTTTTTTTPSASFDSTTSTTEFTGGIPPIAIPKESLELLRELDSDELDTTKEKKKSSSTSKSKKKLFGKISFRPKKDRKGRKNNTENMEGDNQLLSRRQKSMRVDAERLNELAMGRMDAMTALLSFVHRESGEGPSINAVDHNGRTSLHYAAELGRSDICTAMLAHFGIMLTIVDEMGTRTPCEIAADRGHTALAALLEARALLYIDPYGLDDEMLDMIMAANEGSSSANSNYQRKNPNGRLVPPHRWFITLSKEDIAREREEVLDNAREKLTKALLETTSRKDDEISPYECANPYIPSSDRDSNLEAYVTNSTPVSDNGEILEGDQKASAPNVESDLPKLTDSHLEQYMTFHKWNIQSAFKAFQENREEAFSAAGVQHAFEKKKKSKEELLGDANTFICPICYDDEVEKEDWMQLGNCGHGFCRDCLKDYLKESANNRTPSHLITCPDHNCDAGISKLDLQSLLQKDDPKTFDCIMDASNDNFITSHTNFRFCPHPGCSGIVHRFPQPKWASADYDENVLNYTGAVCTAVTPPVEKSGKECILTYEGVEDLEYTNCRSRQQPKKAHRFCFSCGEGVHWPLTCERLAEWKERINDEIGKVDDKNGGSDFNELAQKVWLKANTRPCPKCKVPIEKADGCNHMVCHNCHHEFCWICRQDWNLHSTDTGGFFRCNIWREDDEDRIADKDDGHDEDEQGGNAYNNENFFEGMMNDQGYGSSMHTARKAWKRKQEIRRFLDHYSHWEAHKESNTLEQKMADTVCTRLAQVVDAAIDFDGSPTFNFGGKGLSFIHNAFFELAECRLTLRHSYAFSFYRYPSKAFSKASQSPPKSYLGNKRKEKFRFERLQAELETLTEQMSDIVARSHLRASQIQITYLTSGAAEKRLELNNFLFQIYREEKREAMREKQREEEEKKRPVSSAQYYFSQMNNARAELSSSQEMFNRLMQLRNQRYEQTTNPHLTMADLPTNGRDLSMQLMAQDQRLQVIGERLRGMEGLLRSQNRNVYQNDGDGYDDETSSSSIPSLQMWDCSRCTFMNSGGTFCAMCETPRYA